MSDQQETRKNDELKVCKYKKSNLDGVQNTKPNGPNKENIHKNTHAEHRA